MISGSKCMPSTKLAPRLVDLRLGAELGDPADHLGRGDERVVGAEGLRAVPRRAPDPDLGPERALLRHEDREARARRRRDLEAAGLGEHVVGVDRVALVVEQPVGAPPAQGLLVGDREVDQGAAGPEPAVGETAEGDRLRCGEVEHVDRTASPHEAVDDVGAERVAAPAVGVHRHDVGVAHEHERRRVGVGALELHHQALAPRLRLVDLVIPRAGEVAGEQVDAAGLLPGRHRAVVDAPVADQLPQEVGDLGRGIVGSAHADHARPRRAARAPSSANASSIPPATTSRSRPASPSPIRPKCSWPQYDRIATLRVRFRDSGTTGYTSSIRAPRQYSGTCGPGMLVIMRLAKRCACTRARGETEHGRRRVLGQAEERGRADRLAAFLEVGGGAPHRGQAHERIRLPDRERHEHRGDAVPELHALVVVAHRHRAEDLQGQLGPELAPAVEQPRHRAPDPGEDDVVDRAAERGAHALHVVDGDAHGLEAATAPDRRVERQPRRHHLAVDERPDRAPEVGGARQRLARAVGELRARCRRARWGG